MGCLVVSVRPVDVRRRDVLTVHTVSHTRLLRRDVWARCVTSQVSDDVIERLVAMKAALQGVDPDNHDGDDDDDDDDDDL